MVSLTRVLLFFILAFALAYVIRFFFISALSLDAPPQPLVAFDTVGRGEHILEGYIPVPSVCHTFSVSTSHNSEGAYNLAFITAEDPTRDCAPSPTEKPYSVIIFAPSVGTHFTATIDEKEVPLYVIHSYLP